MRSRRDALLAELGVAQLDAKLAAVVALLVARLPQPARGVRQSQLDALEDSSTRGWRTSDALDGVVLLDDVVAHELERRRLADVQAGDHGRLGRRQAALEEGVDGRVVLALTSLLVGGRVLRLDGVGVGGALGAARRHVDLARGEQLGLELGGRVGVARRLGTARLFGGLLLLHLGAVDIVGGGAGRRVGRARVLAAGELRLQHLGGAQVGRAQRHAVLDDALVAARHRLGRLGHVGVLLGLVGRPLRLDRQAARTRRGGGRGGDGGRAVGVDLDVLVDGRGTGLDRASRALLRRLALLALDATALLGAVLALLGCEGRGTS